MAHWHVLGAGSLGGLWACRLAQAKLPVTLLLRDSARVASYTRGGGLTLIDGAHQQHWPLPAETLTAPEPIAHLLLACKAYDALPAAQALAPRLVPGAVVLLLQNGLGSQQAVAQALPHARCIAVSSTEGAWRSAQGAITRAGAGQNWLGDAAAPPAWLADLRQAHIPFEWTAAIEMRLWRKLAINCAINPLTVLLGCANGELAQHRDAVDGLCQELSTLLQACNQPDAAAGLNETVWQVIASTASNYSSMLQDVRAGRRTEVDYLLGYALNQAHAHSLHLPALEALAKRLAARLAAGV
ncbi:putative 2-dehydropantoate 2-reductase [Pseudomonas sp. KNUC1026]|uniref:putative 2-dehydropantoate 2-reductase n=1 Tax=Pseudomonas sp. KNUC1026 TaxID=2893890 RepID=UPI001F25C4AD|nr:putative 2-dehydropantoate 2-reductase [Pseudomonas sp. KNUC1026]UFH48515.1 putative 2-dehydropantoate 2-reductase [Pseudomonas sp. KNUC1026]